MIGIVVVSHSAALAAAAVDLAQQMVGDEGPVVEVAAGADGGLGTDAMAVSEAVRRAASPDGVLVLVDLGSAVMSAEMALELAPDVEGVRISPAPLVEGLVVAVVRAAGGASLDVVAREAEAALTPKVTALGGPAPSAGAEVEGSGGSAGADGSASDGSGSDGSGSDGVRVRLVNPGGLHARPAAQVAAAVGALSAEVVVTCGDRRADAASALELMTLQAGQGDEVTVSATGPDADAARDAVVTLARDGFGEL